MNINVYPLITTGVRGVTNPILGVYMWKGLMNEYTLQKR